MQHKIVYLIIKLYLCIEFKIKQTYIMESKLEIYYSRTDFFDIKLPTNEWCVLIFKVYGLVAKVGVLINKKSNFKAYRKPEILIETVKKQISIDFPNAIIKTIAFVESLERM